MPRITGVFAPVVVLLGLSSLLATALASPADTAPASEASPTANTAALSPADCLAALTELNDAGKLVPEAAFPGVRLNGLTEDGCSGIRLPNGARLVGIDLGASGFEGSVSEQGDDGSFGASLTFRMMGFLYSEFPFSIAGQTLPAGAWAVEAFNASLRLVGNHETETRYDPMQSKEIPLPKTVQIELKVPIPESVIGSGSVEIPHFAIVPGDAGAVLQVQGNEWILGPQ
jgi:hypothetical protein